MNKRVHSVRTPLGVGVVFLGSVWGGEYGKDRKRSMDLGEKPDLVRHHETVQRPVTS